MSTPEYPTSPLLVELTQLRQKYLQALTELPDPESKAAYLRALRTEILTFFMKYAITDPQQRDEYLRQIMAE